MRILVTGSTGLVGTALSSLLTSSGHEVVPVVRRAPGAGEMRWDPARGEMDTAGLEGADAVIHLAGENIAGGRWNAARKQRIRDSRVNGTRLLAEAITACERPPTVLVCASAIGLYGHLIEAANCGTIDSGRLRTFNLDEYIGLPGGNAQQRTLHPESYSYFMLQNFFGPLQRKPLQTELPWANIIDQAALVYELERHPRDWKSVGRGNGHAIVIRRDAKSRYLHWVRNRVLDGYGRMIRKAGGVDLQILGVGGRGHIAFHEAGIPFKLGGLLLSLSKFFCLIDLFAQ